MCIKNEGSPEVVQKISTGITGRNQSLLNGRSWIGAHTRTLCMYQASQGRATDQSGRYNTC